MPTPPFLGQPQDTRDAMTPDEERTLLRWAKWGLLALLVLLALVIHGARG